MYSRSLSLIGFLYRIFLKKKKEKNLFFPSKGECYDLQEIYDGMNAQYFQSKLELKISWFGKGNVPKTRVLFGSYHHKTKSIKVNRFLDQKDIPLHVVQYIVYHEMLHCVLPPKRKMHGRRSIHHHDFKEREKQFQDYELAKEFIKSWVLQKYSKR